MGKRHPHWIICITGLLFLHSFGYGQLQFDKSEYAARRQNLMEFIPDGIAIIRGAELPGSYMEYYQNNDFMYFSGVEIPNAILIIDGKRKESTLFFTISESSARNEGIPFDLVRNPREVTGIEHVSPIESFSSVLNSSSSQVRVFYTSFKPEELMRECTKEKFRARQRDMTLNEWDGRLTRELQFVKLLRERFPTMSALVSLC